MRSPHIESPAAACAAEVMHLIAAHRIDAPPATLRSLKSDIEAAVERHMANERELLAVA